MKAPTDGEKMRAPTGIVMVLRALGVKFDAEEVEKVLARVIAEVPATIEKLESMKQTFESIDKRLGVIEYQGRVLVGAMEFLVKWVEQTEPKVNKMEVQQQLFATYFQNTLLPLREAYGQQRPASDSDSAGTGYRDGGI